ncbi:glycolate oxidase subunit GlcF [Bosea sp. (in: a-proteobacteria)]|uniref:glycolate oxidase subunit GlcF n=1 Tax=Bosea sp. (in: a-proteobacteria) TaxID=1871050 RepID=UPI002635AA07|nr:glycolate oxidase subunit GlcF [Bosea sp. (in: a-proteobacteria)]MCO5092468.1 glycolate oxidase subunit GlcF [Bosea sp. (in: a-proteobacteria)]
MQTNFTPERLASDPRMPASEKILRTCVHCGFCTATCPTYLLLGDELDSPRGRIYLIKDMLETGKPVTDEVVTHIDRCLSCLSCMTTCPSGVHYMHLIDHARAHIEETYERSWHDRLLRKVLAAILPYPGRLRAAMLLALPAKPFASVLGLIPAIGPRLKAMLALAPARLPTRSAMEGPQSFSPEAGRVKRVALLSGCAQPVLNPAINEATIRLLNRHGVEVVLPKGEGCCGALVHHMGREHDALSFARANIDAWTAEIEGEGLDAILITASGCGTTIKDYGFMFRNEPAYAEKAARVAALAKDITEFLETMELSPVRDVAMPIAYHSACSMQHGQQLKDGPKRLLTGAGFKVKDVPEGHICCGSAGVYNILQPEIAGRLRERKIGNIERTRPVLVATGNIGCMTQIAKGFADKGSGVPVVHTAELLDWATGGPLPEKLARAGIADRPLRERAPAAE